MLSHRRPTNNVGGEAAQIIHQEECALWQFESGNKYGFASLVWSFRPQTKQKKKPAETGVRGKIKGHFEQLHLSNFFTPDVIISCRYKASNNPQTAAATSILMRPFERLLFLKRSTAPVNNLLELLITVLFVWIVYLGPLVMFLFSLVSKRKTAFLVSQFQRAYYKLIMDVITIRKISEKPFVLTN